MGFDAVTGEFTVSVNSDDFLLFPSTPLEQLRKESHNREKILSKKMKAGVIDFGQLFCFCFGLTLNLLARSLASLSTTTEGGLDYCVNFALLRF